MTVEQLADKLKVAPRTIYSWVEKRQIPHYKIGQGLRFDSIEIDEWIKQKRVPIEETGVHEKGVLHSLTMQEGETH